MPIGEAKLLNPLFVTNPLFLAMRLLLISLLSLWAVMGQAQKTLRTSANQLTLVFDQTETYIDLLDNQPTIPVELECYAPRHKGTLSDGKQTLSFTLSKGKEVHFRIKGDYQATWQLHIRGIEPNADFSDDYINAHRGKVTVQIHEVSELANILMVLHPDAEKDGNMFDTRTDYYQRVKAYFAPYADHPAVKRVQEQLGKPSYHPEQQTYIFPIGGYKYYYALKMNACAYTFDHEGRICHTGSVKEIGKSWNSFDPMADLKLFEDFARVSNFRKFYADNQPYYNELLATFDRLSPVGKMQQWLDKKFGFGYDSYMIFFSPLNSGAQAATQFKRGEFKQTFMFVCKSPVYPEYSPTLNELLASWIVFTEIDHNYVNPVSDKNLPYINRVFSNRARWAQGDVTQAYPDPYAVFNEYMTFGLYTLYAIDHYSEAEVMEFLPKLESMMEQVRGFIRFKDFNRALLARYQKNKEGSMEALFQYMMYWALPINNEK